MCWLQERLAYHRAELAKMRGERSADITKKRDSAGACLPPPRLPKNKMYFVGCLGQVQVGPGQQTDSSPASVEFSDIPKLICLVCAKNLTALGRERARAQQVGEANHTATELKRVDAIVLCRPPFIFRKIIFIELMTSDRTLEASREGLK